MLHRLWQLSTVTASLLVGAIVFAFKFDLLESLWFAGLAYAVFNLFSVEMRVVAPLLVLLFALGYFGLIGVIQFVIAVSVITALFALKEIKLTGNTYNTLFYPLRTAGLATAVVFVPSAILYILWRGVIKTPNTWFRLYSIVAVVLYFVYILTQLEFSIYSLFTFGFLAELAELKPALTSPVTWLGVVAYEELFTRPLGGIGNAFFVLYHLPSRYAALELFAVVPIIIIALGTLWLADSYRHGGIVGSIISHIVYNTFIVSYVLLPVTMWPVLITASLILYFGFRKHA